MSSVENAGFSESGGGDSNAIVVTGNSSFSSNFCAISTTSSSSSSGGIASSTASNISGPATSSLNVAVITNTNNNNNSATTSSSGRQTEESCSSNTMTLTDPQLLTNAVKSSANHAKSTLSHIASMYGDPETSDVVLTVGAMTFPAHRIVLAQSPVFKTMLYGSSWQESSAKQVQLNEIEQYLFAFEGFLKYLYGRVLTISWHNVEALVYFGDKYAVDALLNECLAFFYHQVEVSGDLLSALSGWKTIRRILTQRQNTNCLNVLKSLLFSNIELIMKSENIINAMDEDDMMAIISCDEVVCRTEFSLFKLLEHWLSMKTTEATRMTFFLKFTQFLRLPFMHVQEMSYVENSPRRLFGAETEDFKAATSAIKSFLCDAYKYHVICAAERDALMTIPKTRLYLDGSACMKYRLMNTDGLSSWSKMDSYFQVKSSMSTADAQSRDWGFCVTLMRKINVRRQLQPSSTEKQRSLLSLEISQNFCGPVPFKRGIIYIHERRGDSVLRRPLTRFDFASTRMKSDIMLENINFDDVIVKNSPYHYPDELGNLVFLALDIFLLVQ